MRRSSAGRWVGPSVTSNRMYQAPAAPTLVGMAQQQTAAGWYPIDAYTDRWWDGEQWTGATRPRAQQPQVTVTRYPQRYRPGMHLVLTICTLGLWAPVWLLDWLVKSYQWRHVRSTTYR